MRTMVKLTVVALVITAALRAQPSIGGIVNSASFAAAPLDANAKPIGNNNIAQGAIFSVFGTGMGPAALVAPASLPLPTTLPAANGTSITVTSGGQTLKAFMVYSFAGQLA